VIFHHRRTCSGRTSHSTKTNPASRRTRVTSIGTRWGRRSSIWRRWRGSPTPASHAAGLPRGSEIRRSAPVPRSANSASTTRRLNDVELKPSCTSSCPTKVSPAS